MRSLFRSLTSRSTKSSSKNIINSRIVQASNLKQNFNDCIIPAVVIKEIYKKGSFEFIADYTIKTVEQDIPLRHQSETIQLLNQEFT